MVDYFLVEAVSREIQAEASEIEEVLWVPMEQVLEMEHYANNRRLVESALALLKT